MGTANSGHYYSYIRPRDGGGEWLEFNDTIVSAFDVKVRVFVVDIDSGWLPRWDFSVVVETGGGDGLSSLSPLDTTSLLAFRGASHLVVMTSAWPLLH